MNKLILKTLATILKEKKKKKKKIKLKKRRN